MPDELKDDIAIMNKTFTMGVGFEDSDNKTEPPTTDSPDIKTEPPTTDESPTTDEPKTDAPATDSPTTDAPATDAPDDRDQTILDLRAKLAEKDITTKPPTTKAPLTFEDQDFIKDLDLEDLSSTPEKLNSVLNSVYQRAITEAQKMAGAEINSSVPNMITAVANLQKSAVDFYDSNADLKPFKKVVATIFDELIATNPNRPYSEVMLDVAPEVRKRLELPTQVTKKVDKGNPPKLPNKKSKPGRANIKPKPNPIEDGINEMNEVIRR